MGEGLGHDEVATVLRAVVEARDYPCLGARSVFHRDAVTVRMVGELGTREAAGKLLAELQKFAAATAGTSELVSFVAVFDGPEIESEEQFESLLWKTLQHVHDADPEPWSDAVSHDPADPDFAFSVAGTPYFVIGMSPVSSRLARRIPFPALVFNLHAQFEEMRASGRFDRMRDVIRSRDKKLQGTVNPMVCDHGRGSSARQYSGRQVEESWQPAFEFRGGDSEAA